MKGNKKPTISVVTVARDEETSIESVIEETVRILSKNASKYEIIVNNDASIDNTGSILNKLSKKYRFISVFHRKKAIGIARGVEFLYGMARYEYTIPIPGDGQYSLRDIGKMLRCIRGGADVVVGKRIIKQYDYIRKIVSFFYNFLPKILFGVELYDAGSTKLYKTKLLRKTKPLSRGVFNEAERLIRAQQLGYIIDSVPVRHFKRKGGVASGASFSLVREGLVDMIRFWIRLRLKR